VIQKHHNELLALYHGCYNETLKPLLATVESNYEHHPAPILNEIRSFNNHIARCYLPSVDDQFIKDNLWKARGHLIRAILDCFKYLNVYYHDGVKKFERDCRRVDLTTISNGEFYVSYRQLKKSAKSNVRKAKKKETTDPEKALELYEDAYNKYVELDEFIHENLVSIDWAIIKFTAKRLLNIVIWLLTATLAGVILALLSVYGRDIIQFFRYLFESFEQSAP